VRRGACALALLVAACASRPSATLTTAPEAAGWSPFVVAPTPVGAPASPDLAAVRAWQAKRGAKELEAIAYWHAEASTARWDAIARDLIAQELAPTVAGARALAALHVAASDALVACWRAKAEARVPPPFVLDPTLAPALAVPPDPAWPSAEAAVAAAAARVLGRLYPVAAEGLASKAAAVGETRVAGAFACPGDVTAGRALGEAAGAAVVARLDAEGDGRGPAPAGYAERDAEVPAAGRWGSWLGLAAPPLPSPPAPDLAAVLERNRTLDIRQRNLADKWLTEDPAARWSARGMALAAEARLDFPHAQRLMATLAAAQADAATLSWRLAYEARQPRPRTLAPTLETIRFTPAHPAWPDEAAAIAGAASEVLAAAFPTHAEALRHEAAEAAEAGFDGGQHYPADGRDGLALGVALGRGAARRLPGGD
jgi:hypothetical protein